MDRAQAQLPWNTRTDIFGDNRGRPACEAYPYWLIEAGDPPYNERVQAPNAEMARATFERDNPRAVVLSIAREVYRRY